MEWNANDYARWFASPRGRAVERLEIRAIERLVLPESPATLLDAGSGDGRFSLPLAQHGIRVTGIDASPVMVAAATAKASARHLHATYRQGRVEELPFPTETFDAALLHTVLCFVKEPIAALKEVYRVLKPGGIVVLGELNAASRWTRRRREKPEWEGTRFHTRSGLRNLLAAAGFIPEGEAGAVLAPPVTENRLYWTLAGWFERLVPAARFAVGTAVIYIKGRK
jgi:2-polyprenyl-3-methyl-5-hydroxy-6-metoxy-1,4-benzoquinol methylase